MWDLYKNAITTTRVKDDLRNHLEKQIQLIHNDAFWNVLCVLG